MLIRKITDLIGNTPLLELPQEVHGLKNISLYAKLEMLNPFGSIKDKPAWNILGDELEAIKASEKTVIESSSGNMAKALQALCSMHGIPFKIITNRIKVKEVKQILQLMGADIEELPGLSECPDPTDPNDPLTYIERRLSSEPGKYFHTSQYTNPKNLEAHYHATGAEIAADIGTVDYFIGGLGSTGSTRGAGTYLREQNQKIKIVGVIAPKGEVIPGIRNTDEMREVGLFQSSFYDDQVVVNEQEGIDGMLALIRRCGVLAGPTSGATFIGTLKYLRAIDAELPTRAKAVFIACDRVEWYLSYLQKRRPELFDTQTKRSGLALLEPREVAEAPEIPVASAPEWIRTKVPTIIDLRGALGFKIGHLPGSTNIPQHILEEIVGQGEPFSPGRPLLFVCPIGEQSKRFAALARRSGVEATSLQGGFAAWKDKGFDVETGAAREAR